MPDRINDVRPFRALHYDPAVVGEVGPCLSQPYDVISPAQQEAYYRQCPYNVIRLILNRQEPSDDAAGNRYTRARDLLSAWRASGVLHGTRRPSFWVYEQQFDLPGIGRKTIKGFIGAVRLHDYAEGRILPHEKVLTGPLEDRIRLTEATNTQFEYIWSLYQDRAYVIDNVLDEQEREPAIVDFVEQPVGVRHRMWRLSDPARCDIVARTMARLRIYIADGHHRYQTMLTVRDRMRRLHPEAGPDAPWEFIMMFLVNSEHEGLTILPTHRLHRGRAGGEPEAARRGHHGALPRPQVLLPRRRRGRGAPALAARPRRRDAGRAQARRLLHQHQRLLPPDPRATRRPTRSW